MPFCDLIFAIWLFSHYDNYFILLEYSSTNDAHATKCYIYLKKLTISGMERIYRQLWNEAGEIKGERYSQRLSEYRNGTITLKKGILQPPEGEKNAHTYYTFEIKESILFNDELKEALLELVTGALGELLKKNGYKKGDKTLCVGLGNEKMTADSLGAITVNNLHITRHIIDGSPLKALSKMHNLSAIKSSVSGVTGLNSYDIINGVIQKTTPDFVIAVDTLACKSVRGWAECAAERRGYTAGRREQPKQKLDIQSLGIPVIAWGAFGHLRQGLIRSISKATMSR